MLLVLDWEKFSILHYFIMANYLNKITNVDGLRQGEFFYPLLYARIVNKFESNIFMHACIQKQELWEWVIIKH